MFQRALDAYRRDIFGSMIWTALSLVAGAVNLAPLAQQSVLKNVALRRFFSVFCILQLATLLGAFLRMLLIMAKFLQWL
jgi:hypothetical protein